MLDPMKRLFLRHGIIICQLTLLLVAFIPPANLFSLIYIFFFQVFLYMIYLYGNGDRIVT